MDYLRFHCPACNHLLIVPPEAAGLSGPCPNCQTIIKAPEPESLPQPQPLNPPTAEPKPEPVPESEPVLIAPEPIPEPEPVAEAPLKTSFPTQDPTRSTAFTKTSNPSQTHTEKGSSENIRESLREKPAKNTAAQEDKKAQRTSGLSLPQALLLSFISAAAFFIFGFFLGRQATPTWPSIVEATGQHIERNTANNQPSEAEPEEINIAQLSSFPPEQSEPAQELIPTHSDARATLEAFFGAETWSARSAYVLYPTQMLGLMEATAAKYGDGPIAIEGLSLERDQPDKKVFWIKTPQNERPFSVILIQAQGGWLVDWSGFADFYYNRLSSFTSGEEGPLTGVFRVFLKGAPGETSPLSPARCLVMTPQDSTAHEVISAPDSPARIQLAEIFQSYLQSDPKTFKEAIAGTGIPLTIKLSRNNTQNPTIRLVEILSTSWAPLPPDKSALETASSFY